MKPLCPYFGECGGCTLQHIPYESQLENKANALKKAINYEEIQVFPGEPYHYRNRMDYVFSENGLGLRRKGTWWHGLDLKECVISNEKLNSLLKEVREYFLKPGQDFFDLKKKAGTLRYAVIRAPRNSSSISFVLNPESLKLKEAESLIKDFAAKTSAENILVTYVKPQTDSSISTEYITVKGSDQLKETYMGKEFYFNAQGFFQNNSVMAERMHEYCHSRLKEKSAKKATLLDLYSGVGTFGIINSSLFNKTIMIEEDSHCAASAEKNIAHNKARNTSIIRLDAKKLRELEISKPLYVITDPPRSGMHPKTIKQLNALEPEAIIYVSCNPRQLGEDLLKLESYKIKSAALFDFFPQTTHSEAVIELEKK